MCFFVAFQVVDVPATIWPQSPVLEAARIVIIFFPLSSQYIHVLHRPSVDLGARASMTHTGTAERHVALWLRSTSTIHIA
jgi:hypothetical protein